MSIQEELKNSIKERLPGLDCVIGWGKGPDPLRHTPLFMWEEADVDGLLAGYCSVSNPALFLPEHKGKKIGLVVKGCDARSVGQLLAEGLVKREDLVLIGFPCQGVIDTSKVAAALIDTCEPGEILSMREEGEWIVLSTPKGEVKLDKKEMRADKCGRCIAPDAQFADVFVGERREPDLAADDYADLAAFEEKSLDERMSFWENEMSRCIRCYACRNACPLCVCRDQCMAQSREPHWVSQADSLRDKLFFQVIHATHQAGRCTGCGECQRACPMDIPVLLLKRSLSKQVEQLFDYRAGMDSAAMPPLLSFCVEEAKIKERDW